MKRLLLLYQILNHYPITDPNFFQTPIYLVVASCFQDWYRYRLLQERVLSPVRKKDSSLRIIADTKHPCPERKKELKVASFSFRPLTHTMYCKVSSSCIVWWARRIKLNLHISMGTNAHRTSVTTTVLTSEIITGTYIEQQHTKVNAENWQLFTKKPNRLWPPPYNVISPFHSK